VTVNFGATPFRFDPDARWPPLDVDWLERRTREQRRCCSVFPLQKPLRVGSEEPIICREGVETCRIHRLEGPVAVEVEFLYPEAGTMRSDGRSGTAVEDFLATENPTPVTCVISTLLKAGECIRHSI